MKSYSSAGQVVGAVTVRAMQKLAGEMKLGLGKPKPKRAGFGEPTL